MIRHFISAFWKRVGKTDAARLAKQFPPEGINEIVDVDYALSGDRFRYADVYVKAERAAEKLPAVFDIHGGGWYYGDKELNKIYCLNLAAEGSFRVINLSYRLAPSVGVAEQLNDVVAALNYFYDYAEKFGIDADNLFLTGDSAGGNLAGLAVNALTNAELKRAFGVEVKPRFRAVGFTSAAFTLSALSRRPFVRAYFKPIYAGNARLAEYMDYEKNAAGVPLPSCIITGDGDFLRKDALLTAEKLTERGADVLLVDLKGEKNKLGHVFNVTYPLSPEGSAANAAMLNFFKKHLRK